MIATQTPAQDAYELDILREERHELEFDLQMGEVREHELEQAHERLEQMNDRIEELTAHVAAIEGLGEVG